MSNEMGKRIRQRRMELGLSQGDLARRMGFQERSIIAKYENGRKVPVQNLPELAAALETTPAYLLGTLQEKLLSLDITVEEDAFGNAVITDRKTGMEQSFAKSDWIQLQEQEDFRRVFQFDPSEASRPSYAVHMNKAPSEQFETVDDFGTGFSSLLADKEDFKTRLLNGESFISAASFMETAKVLQDVEISGKIDDPNDVIVSGTCGTGKSRFLGKLIPAGTGMRRYNAAADTAQPSKRLAPDFLERLQQLTDEELTRVDAFVQGILATRKPKD